MLHNTYCMSPETFEYTIIMWLLKRVCFKYIDTIHAIDIFLRVRYILNNAICIHKNRKSRNNPFLGSGDALHAACAHTRAGWCIAYLQNSKKNRLACEPVFLGKMFFVIKYYTLHIHDLAVTSQVLLGLLLPDRE